MRAWLGQSIPSPLGMSSHILRCGTTPPYQNLPQYPPPQIWAVKCIKYLDQNCSGGELRTSDTLKAQFDVPNIYFFKYLQLRHACHFKRSLVAFYTSILQLVLRDDSLTKPLSNIFRAMLPSVHSGLKILRWMLDFPGLDDENWEKLWECYFLQLVSARDRLVQIKIIH